MKAKRIVANLLAMATLASVALMPVAVSAQSRSELDRESKRRQQKKNEWRNIAIGSGALGVLGLLKKDNTLFFGGTAGALYSTWRYEQDRKSQSKTDRARAQYFSRSHFYRNGKRYTRKTVWKNGQKHYRFVRG